MSHNPNMTAGERVLWRQVAQAAHEAARSPHDAGKARALKKALAGANEWRLPDLRPLPSGCFRAFLLMARGFAAETDPKLRFALASRLVGMADAAGDILDGLPCDTDQQGRGDTSCWANRADRR